MKNFLKIAEGLDVTPVMMALKARSHLWNQNDLRTRHQGTAHAQADDIWLRFNELKEDLSAVVDDIHCINYPAMGELPEARQLILGLMARVGCEQLGRSIITRLKPGACITPHEDQGAPATYYERFHITLHSRPGCVFRAGDEQVQMRTGEVWWFNNTIEHEVQNYSDDDRLTLIVDIKVLP